MFQPIYYSVGYSCTRVLMEVNLQYRIYATCRYEIVFYEVPIGVS